MGELYLLSAISILIYMFLLFLVAQKIKDNSIVDIAWGMGFVIIAAVSYFNAENTSIRQLVVLLLVTLWGTRLALHIFIRSIGRGEDFRYANFRKSWGKNVRIIAFFRVFMMQGVIMLLLSYPIIRVNTGKANEEVLLLTTGIIVWTIGFLFQAIGDRQLERFKKQKKDRDEILDRGLWKYSRHPNYFGEATMWWGIFIIVLPVELGWTTILSPILINLLLLKVSGVPFLDKRFEGNVEYQKYKARTNRFIPWLPKKI